MGRHSRKDPAPARPAPVRTVYVPAPEPVPSPYGEQPPRTWPEPTVTHGGYATADRRPPAPGARGGHPEQDEPGGARPDSVYGDWHGVPRARTATATAARPARTDTDTPAFGTPAVGFPRVTLEPPPPRAPSAGSDALSSTGSHRRVPGPRKPVPAPAPAAAPAAPVEDRPGSGRGVKVLTYTGMAAAAVTTVLAVVVAGQVAADRDKDTAASLAATDDGAARAADSAAPASRSDGRPTPDAPAGTPAAAPAAELTYEQRMAEQLPVDAKLTGPGTFDTVPGVAKAPGKGRLVRYRVDVEQGLGMDPQLFAEAVHRTLNDPRSWGHGGTRTFERVPGGEADFVITLASPGTTGKWCAKSGLDTTIDNVSCDSASTERVMINAFRWAQGSPTYGPDQMFAYRQMLINHEVGHRLGHGHVSCRTPGALAPIMQQQTKSLDIDGIACKPNPWAHPGS
ncbi:DUF3152 domain-containing protein [Streptomyces sp. NPDC058662]|uniref:DUF3152 domain-containing protein n=1 Tax=Streptomyces sp. NPDC058662 TaxID=3346583 RepID=UPI00366816BE